MRRILLMLALVGLLMFSGCKQSENVTGERHFTRDIGGGGGGSECDVTLDMVEGEIVDVVVGINNYNIKADFVGENAARFIIKSQEETTVLEEDEDYVAADGYLKLTPISIVNPSNVEVCLIAED
ncbi:MAG: hypothetical protein KJ709_08030 [Nanoarchaeota archaeon]|nr:hypothetical protein [Nanoarchaeota archaeon]